MRTTLTDERLWHAATKRLNRLARKRRRQLRQSYLRVAKRAAMMALVGRMMDGRRAVHGNSDIPERSQFDPALSTALRSVDAKRSLLFHQSGPLVSLKIFEALHAYRDGILQHREQQAQASQDYPRAQQARQPVPKATLAAAADRSCVKSSFGKHVLPPIGCGLAPH